MFDEKTILARLQNGEDASTIANEMTAAINSAMKAYEDQKKKEAEEAEAKRKAEEAKRQRNIQKRDEMEEILALLTKWVNNYYDTKLDVSKVSPEDAIELIDSCFDYVNALNGLADLTFLAGKPRTVKPMKVEVKKGNSSDDTLNAWLKSMGW